MYNQKHVAVILLAAGMGKRMQADVNKVWLKLNGQSVLSHALRVFQEAAAVDLVVLVAPANELDGFGSFLNEAQGTLRTPVYLTSGGKERQNSVANGLEYLKSCPEFEPARGLVLVHDAARALVTRELVEGSIAGADEYKAAGIGVPVKDTIKVADPQGFVANTPERANLWAIQTPQAFDYQLLFQCYQKVAGLDKLFSDDCGVVEYCGYPVKLIPGSYDNIKITTPEDMIIAESILRRRKDADRAGI